MIFIVNKIDDEFVYAHRGSIILDDTVNILNDETFYTIRNILNDGRDIFIAKNIGITLSKIEDYIELNKRIEKIVFLDSVIRISDFMKTVEDSVSFNEQAKKMRVTKFIDYVRIQQMYEDTPEDKIRAFWFLANHPYKVNLWKKSLKTI